MPDYNLLKSNIEQLLKDSCFYCFDVETTGLSSEKDRIIQISMIKCNSALEEIDRKNIYINPGEEFLPLSKKIIDLTGITSEKLIKEGVNEDLAVKKILDFMGNNPSVIGWNVDFDNRFLKQLFARNLIEFELNHVVDAIKIARQLIPKTEVGNYKLKTISDYFGLSDDITFHNSMDDTYVTYLIFKVLCQEILEKEQSKNGNIRPIVYQISFWKKAFGKNNILKRLYISTNIGNLYYDLYTDQLISKDVDLNLVDTAYIIKFLYWATQTNHETIHNFTGSIKFN